MKKQLIEFYLDWVNNYVTLSKMAEAYGLTNPQAQKLIELGRELNEQAAKDKAEAKEPKPDKYIHIAVLSHKHGTNIYTAKTEQGLTNQLYDFVKDDWNEHEDMGEIPEDKQEAIDEYFGVNHETGVFIEYKDSINITKIPD